MKNAKELAKKWLQTLRRKANVFLKTGLSPFDELGDSFRFQIFLIGMIFQNIRSNGEFQILEPQRP